MGEAGGEERGGEGGGGGAGGTNEKHMSTQPDTTSQKGLSLSPRKLFELKQGRSTYG